MRAAIQVSITEFRLILRSFITVFFSLVFPTGMLLLFGSIYGNDPTPFFGGHGAIDASLPGYLGISISVVGLMSLPLTIGQYRQKKILKRFKATPLSPSVILGGQVFGSLLLIACSAGFVILIARVLYGYRIDGNVGGFVLSFFITLLAIFSIGFLVASMAKTEKAASLICNLIYFPMIFLSGSTFPLEMFPDNLRTVANLLPLTHGIEMMKQLSFGSTLSDMSSHAIVLIGYILVCGVVSIRVFSWE